MGINDDYSYLSEHKMRLAELQDIAAMDRLAAELAPQARVSRWANQRRAAYADAPVRRMSWQRLLRGVRRHHA